MDATKLSPQAQQGLMNIITFISQNGHIVQELLEHHAPLTKLPDMRFEMTGFARSTLMRFSLVLAEASILCAGELLKSAPEEQSFAAKEQLKTFHKHRNRLKEAATAENAFVKIDYDITGIPNKFSGFQEGKSLFETMKSQDMEKMLSESGLPGFMLIAGRPSPINDLESSYDTEAVKVLCQSPGFKEAYFEILEQCHSLSDPKTRPGFTRG